MTAQSRKIIHVDMDAFYASVEQRDDPALRGRPVIVGGDPRGRGVVAAASYEARERGIHSAMSCAQAHRLAPNAVFLRPRFDVYRDVSLKIRAIFREYTDLVEPISLDEAFLDVTHSPSNLPTATEIAWEIKGRIWEQLGLRASAGVAPTKLVAKIASDFDKPDGFVVVKPHQVEPFLQNLPIELLWGVGASTAERIHRIGVATIGELRNIPRASLERRLGNIGRLLHGMSRGNDPRGVSPHRIARSRSAEETFAEDVQDIPTLHAVLDSLAERVSRALMKLQKPARTLTLKVRYNDFQTITRSLTLAQHTWDADVIAHTSRNLLARSEITLKPIRLLGVGGSNLLHECGSQQQRFPFMEIAPTTP